jgi:hypothetical protein
MTIEIKNRWTGAIITTINAANLRSADLRSADLRSADLRSADLRSADLRSADLRSADLGGADLRSADLGGADLGGADLGGANLRSANLRSANLRSADLRSANLRSANLRGADLGGADLGGADLGGADLGGADLGGALGLSTFVVAGQGALVGWKKCSGNGIVELMIPRSARRVNAYGSRKCRAEYAVVVSAPEGAVSQHDSTFAYKTGETVRPANGFCDDPRIECAAGIHFFITREEAEAY